MSGYLTSEYSYVNTGNSIFTNRSRFIWNVGDAQLDSDSPLLSNDDSVLPKDRVDHILVLGDSECREPILHRCLSLPH